MSMTEWSRESVIEVSKLDKISKLIHNYRRARELFKNPISVSMRGMLKLFPIKCLLKDGTTLLLPEVGYLGPMLEGINMIPDTNGLPLIVVNSSQLRLKLGGGGDIC